MICLKLPKLATVADARSLLQTAVGVEFGTLPPYLYALYSIPPGTNRTSQSLILSVALQEMIHMCLACNILNALGGDPIIQVQQYPGPLPGDIGPDGKPLNLHLYPFSLQAMDQAMKIEEPEDPPDFPVTATLLGAAAPQAVTIGQFYEALDTFLATLPASDWTANRNQIADNQFFQGQLFAVDGYADAKKAIQEIVSEGEGTRKGTEYDPLDFQDQPAHFFRFGEIFHDRLLTRDPGSIGGYTWGPEELGVAWPDPNQYITDPGTYDFSNEPEAVRLAQDECNRTFSAMISALQRAVTGISGALGEAVRHMFDLRMAALHAFTVPLNDGRFAGPAFLFIHPNLGGDQ